MFRYSEPLRFRVYTRSVLPEVRVYLVGGQEAAGAPVAGKGAMYAAQARFEIS